MSSEFEQSVELPLDEFMPVSRPTPVGVDKDLPKPALTDEQALTKLTKGLCEFLVRSQSLYIGSMSVVAC